MIASSSHQFDTYNAAADLLGRNMRSGGSERIAVIDSQGEYSYAELESRVNQFARLLRARGVGQEQRVLLCLLDTVDFPVCFLGAIKAGVVPVPVNTMLKSEDYRYMLADSRAKMLVVSSQLVGGFRLGGVGDHPDLKEILTSGAAIAGLESLSEALQGMPNDFEAAPTRPDDIAFWLYTSGTTGRPKGTMHFQTDLVGTADLYASNVLEITPDDRVFSAAKLFFAYGLGNALTFPFSVGAAAILLDDRPAPETIRAITEKHNPTVFFGVPTLYAMMLNTETLPDTTALRICISAGEALPESVFERWRESTGLEILDGIGSTEMLHIFLSNRIGDLQPGSSGKPVPGYRLDLRDEHGNPVGQGEIGDLYVSGPTSAAGYWNLRKKNADTFQGPWVATGDKYICDEQGYYTHCGRSDDLLKVGGIYVSPMEVENALLSHPAVDEVAVVGSPDNDQLIKPRAFVVPAAGTSPSTELARELVEFVSDKLAAYKRPRWVEFIDELPKTATGKIQRYKLRQ